MRPWISSAVFFFLNLCLDVCSPCQVLWDVYTEVLEATHPLHRGPTDHKRSLGPLLSLPEVYNQLFSFAHVQRETVVLAPWCESLHLIQVCGLVIVVNEAQNHSIVTYKCILLPLVVYITYCEPIASIFNLSLSTNVILPSWKSAMFMPLLKGGDPSDLNNYRPISKLPVLAKVFESMVNDQMKENLLNHNILNAFHSGFRAGHSTITATTLVTNYLITALDKRQHCAALFVDLTKAFDLVDHALLLQRLKRET